MDNPKQLQRRDFITKAGLFSAGAVATVATQSAVKPSEAAVEVKVKSSWPHPFVQLDPERAAKDGYNAYYTGNKCCYATVEAILVQLRETVGEPYTSIPSEMFRYGEAGVVGWATLCGTLNASCAMINLVCNHEDAGKLINELMAWYTNSSLPNYVPEGMEPIVKSQSGSPLCHVSVGKWCEASGFGAKSKERSNRCARLVSDVTRKTCELLNAHHSQKFVPQEKISDVVGECMECHGVDGLNNTRGKMACVPCHTPEDHPTPLEGWDDKQ